VAPPRPAVAPPRPPVPAAPAPAPPSLMGAEPSAGLSFSGLQASKANPTTAGTSTPALLADVSRKRSDAPIQFCPVGRAMIAALSRGSAS
jgi:hypothetical protein